jgi:hypothetical protein
VLRALTLVAVAAVLAIGAAPAAEGAKRGSGGGKQARKFPWEERVRDAVRYGRSRTGAVSFAVVDERGRVHSFRRGARYASASLVKAMLLVAYLRRGGVRGRRLHPYERALLGPMIRFSDNDAASAVHAQVGSGGLNHLARRAGMRRFIPNPVWGGCQVAARDQALFFSRLRRLLPERHRSYALGLLANVGPGQRWGVPRGRPKGWRVHFKGGWNPDGGGWRVHQGALLRRGSRRLGLAVLTSGGPSLAYGSETIEGVTRRLLRGYR